MGKLGSNWTFQKIRDKKSLEIGVIQCEGVDSSGPYYKVFWSKSLKYEKINRRDKFEEKFEYVVHDFSDISLQILEYLREPYLARIPQIVARRLDPDYYKVGDIVYFQSPGF